MDVLLKKPDHKNLKKRIFRGVMIALVVLAAIVFIVFQVIDAKNRKANVVYQKEDASLIGTRMEIKRDDLKSINGNIYIPNADNDAMPLIINIHGGAFIARDADSLDTQSDRISRNNNAVVFTIDYTLLPASRMVFFSE